MDKRINPFRPNSPVNPGMFVGRVDELNRLEGSMLQTLADQPEHFMITGERGIGKTSLLMYLRFVAEGNYSILGKNFNFLVIETDIDRSTTQIGLIEKIKMNLNRRLGETEPARNFLKDAWSFLKRVRVMDSCITVIFVPNSDLTDEKFVDNSAFISVILSSIESLISELF